jgi:hypothetical protein
MSPIVECRIVSLPFLHGVSARSFCTELFFTPADQQKGAARQKHPHIIRGVGVVAAAIAVSDSEAPALWASLAPCPGSLRWGGHDRFCGFSRRINNYSCNIKNHVAVTISHNKYITSDVILMITAGQLRASRAILGIDQRKLAESAGLSLPTIQRMEASDGVIRGNVDSLMKLVAALDALGIDLIADNATTSSGGRGIRLKRPVA